MTNRYLHEEIFRGKDAMTKLAACNVFVCGAGALGSNLVVNLARTGFEKIAVIDKDRVEEQNLGTQAYSIDDVGGLKAQLLRNLIYRDLALEIASFGQELRESNIKKLFNGRDLIVDAFDNTKSRQLVTQYCKTQSLPCLHIGVNEQYGEIRWNENYIVPSDQEVDVCDYPLARTLIQMVATVATEVMVRFAVSQERQNYCITHGDMQITFEKF